MTIKFSNLFTDLGLAPDQVRAIVDTLVKVEDPFYVVENETVFDETQRQELYRKILLWDDKVIHSLIANVTSLAYANKVMQKGKIGTFLDVNKDRKFCLGAGNRKQGAVFSGMKFRGEPVAMPIFLAIVAFAAAFGQRMPRPLNAETGKELGTNLRILEGTSVVNGLKYPWSEINTVTTTKFEQQQMELLCNNLVTVNLNSVANKLYKELLELEKRGLTIKAKDYLGNLIDNSLNSKALDYICVGLMQHLLDKSPKEDVFFIDRKMLEYFGDIPKYNLEGEELEYTPEELEFYTKLYSLKPEDKHRFYITNGNVILNWWSLDFKPCDMIFLMTMIEACTISKGVRQFNVEVENKRIKFGPDYIYWDDELMYDYRGRWVHNSLVCSGEGYHLRNGFGTFITAVIETYNEYLTMRQSATATEGCGNKWYRKLFNKGVDMQKEENKQKVAIPMCSEAESGALDEGDRHHHLRYVAYPFKIANYLPLEFANNTVRYMTVYKDKNKNTRAEYAQLSSADSVNLAMKLLVRYNLAHMHKAKSMFLFDGRLLGTRLGALNHINKEEHGIDGVELCLAIAKDLTGESNGIKAMKMLLRTQRIENGEGVGYTDFLGDDKGVGLLFKDEYLFAKFAMEQLYLANFTKLNKLTNRVGLIYPSQADGIDLEDRAFGLFGQIGTLSGGHVYKCMHFRNAIYAPGMGILVTYLKELLQPSHLDETIEYVKQGDYRLVYGTDDFGCKITVDKAENTTHIDYTYNTFTIQLPGNREFEIEGVEIKKGDPVITFTYSNANGEQLEEVIYAKEDGILKDIELSTNVYGSTCVRVNFQRVDNIAKLRQLVKMMITRHASSIDNLQQPEVIYNSFNTNEDGKYNFPDVDIIATGDADKSKDSGISYNDIASETFLRNDPSVIAALNKMYAEDHSDFVLWHGFLGLCRVYDGFVNELITRYGRTVWLKHEDVNPGMLNCVRISYENKIKGGAKLWRKSSLSEVLKHSDLTKAKLEKEGLYVSTLKDGKITKDFANATVIVSDITGTGKLTEYDEILIWLNKGDKTYFWQRTYGLCGRSNDDHVYINLKVEMSTIRQNISSSVSMYSTAECIANGLGDIPGNFDIAHDFMAEGRSNAYRWSALQAMLQNQPIMTEEGTVIPTVKVFSKSGTDTVMSNEFKALLNDELVEACKAKTITFRELALHFKGVILDFNTSSVVSSPEDNPLAALDAKAHGGSSIAENYYDGNSTHEKQNTFTGIPKIWMPAIAAQSENVLGDDDASSLIFKGVRNIIANHKYNDVEQRLLRIKGVLQPIQNSKKSRKSPYASRRGVMVKLHAALNIPVHKVLIAGRYGDSMEVAVRRALGDIGLAKEGDKYYAVVARSPIPFGLKVEIEMVHPSDPRYVLFDGAFAVCHALLAYVSGGDYDGDGYVIVFLRPEEASKLKLLEVQDVLNIIELRTGKEALGFEQEGYICDHWFPKTWKGYVNKEGKLELRCFSLANITTVKSNLCETYHDAEKGYTLTLGMGNKYHKEPIGVSLEYMGKTRIEGIAAAHNVAFRMSVFFNICKTANIPELSKLAKTIFDLANWETYEGGPLAGYSAEAWEVCALLKQWMGDAQVFFKTKQMINEEMAKAVMSKEPDKAKIEAITKERNEALSKFTAAGLNDNEDIIDLVFNACREYYFNWTTNSRSNSFALELTANDERIFIDHVAGITPRELHKLDMYSSNKVELAYIASILKYRIARAVFDPRIKRDKKGKIWINQDLYLALYVWTWDRDIMSELRSNCLALDHLMFYLEHCLPAFNPVLCKYMKLVKNCPVHIANDAVFADVSKLLK